MKYYTTFAATYGSGVYGACTYNDATTCASTGTGTGTTPASSSGATNGGLVNTGFVVMVIATIACLLIFAGFIVRFWRRPHRMAVEPVRVDEDQIDPDQHNSSLS